MLFTSTRQAVALNSAEAIVQGISSEGGLLVPDSFPEVGPADIEACADKSYQEIASAIFSRYLSDCFTTEDIDEIVSTAYGSQFDNKDIAPVVNAKGYHVLELWHGPTSAFKDMALQALPTLLTKAARKIGETREILVLVATSGDTGKAALEGFADIPKTKIGVYYPRDGVSKVQKLQMTTQEGTNVFVMGVNGNFDDAQTGVKRIFGNAALRETLGGSVRLSSANSINFGRLLPQVAYYFYAYSRLARSGAIEAGDKLNFCVPTGNFGNILAGYYAKRMGLPVGKLICASNQNNILTDFFTTGVYDANREFHTTASPSMDILISSNLERMLFEACERDANEVKKCMEALKSNGRYEVGEAMKKELSGIYSAGWCSEPETRTTIAETFKERGYLLDPHTAVAVKVYGDYQRESGDETPTVVVSTASPFKFAEDVLSAVTPEKGGLSGFEAVDALCEVTGQSAPARIASLRDIKEKHTGSCEVGEMQGALVNWLNASKSTNSKFLTTIWRFTWNKRKRS